MNTAAKLSAHGAALALPLVGAYGAGSAVGPLAAAPAGRSDASGAGSTGHGDAHSGTVAEATAGQPGGLASSRGGDTPTPTDSMLTPRTTEDVTFRGTSPDAAAADAPVPGSGHVDSPGAPAHGQ